MTTGITVQRCDDCEHTRFPPTAVCPRCWSASLTRTRCTTAHIEEVTSIDSGRVRIATLRTTAGPVVVGRLQHGKPGDQVALSDRPGESDEAFVPSDPRSSDVLPTARSPLRGLERARLTVPRILQHQAERYPDKPLLVSGDAVWTYQDTASRAAGAASGLSNRGIEPGDRVAVWCDNRPELLEMVLGCAWLGAVVVPLNTALRGPGLWHTLSDSGARALLVDHHLLPLLAEVELPETLREVWLPDTQPPATAHESLTKVSVTGMPRGNEETLPAEVGPGDTMAILYTSGTTGLPKGVCCPHAQFYWWGVTVGECLEIDDNDVLYTCLPLFHTNALNAFFQAVVAGATFVLGPRFSASRFWSDLADSGATVTYLLGAMVQILCSRSTEEYDPRHRARIALSPATPKSSHQEFAQRFGITLVDGFGSTEANMVIGADAAAQRPGQMGVTLPDFETRVVDERGLDVPTGTPGELLCRAKQPFAFATGYFNNPHATAQVWADGWFHTGDRVIEDSDGWFTFVDRIKDSIRRRGENISSLEVEQVLVLHPAIQSAAAFPVPSELAEDEVMAAVVPTPGQRIDLGELIAYCESKLPYFAVPRYLDIVSALPLTENGKVQKSVLRSRGVGDSTWDRHADG